MAKRFDCLIRTKEDLKAAVETFGIVPLFRNSIPGFSVEEHAAPEAWFQSEEGVWEWKGPVIRETGCAYGKFFERKAAFVSRKWFPDLANYRRDGYDFDARWDEGFASWGDKELFDLIEKNGPILSRRLKQMGDYRKGGKKGFDTSVNRLQEQGYVVISDFVYSTTAKGEQYGWGVAEYATAERQLGKAFASHVYDRTPEESYQRLLKLLKTLVPGEDEVKLKRFLK